MEEPNFTYLQSFSSGDKVFEQRIFKIIKMEFPEERDIYLKNIAENNFGLAANNVHKLKHKISILGLEKSYELASQYELNLIEGNNKLYNDFNEILNSMSCFIQKL